MTWSFWMYADAASLNGEVYNDNIFSIDFENQQVTTCPTQPANTQSFAMASFLPVLAD